MHAFFLATFFMTLAFSTTCSVLGTFIAFILIVIVTTTPGAASLDRRLNRGGG
ncbi:unannotated protein [freshwater metagenome]|uniref:Unannotated protein n=1 Tax=freshwater metagenome TaxID=449393 RepID=A0A6J7BG98_9ZZZZ